MTPTGRMHDRVCLVTGSTGIAAASAHRFAAEGAAVFIVSRSEEHAASLAGEMAAFVAVEDLADGQEPLPGKP